MRFTIHVPWLTRSRRLAVMVAAMLLLTAVALPASAAPPEGIEGNVVVVNDAENPVPVTGDVTADVTGSVDVSGEVTVDNEATDPVPVTGSVNATVSGDVGVSGTVGATQSGDWIVGLDATSEGHLANIDAATGALTYDASGNLNVNIAASDVAAGEVVLSDLNFTLLGGGVSAPALLGPSELVETPIFMTRVTTFTLIASESVWIEFLHGLDTVYFARVDATGQTFAPTFAFPLDAGRLRIRNLSLDPAEVWLSVSGF